jgi:hypothetical protein
VHENDGHEWLVTDSRGRQTVALPFAGSEIRPYCAADPTHLLLTASMGSAFVELGTGRARPTPPLPSATHSAAGDPDTGFWLADRLGFIYYLGATSGQVLHMRVPLNSVTSASLICSKDLLLWRGHCLLETRDGADTVDALAFYRRRGPAQIAPVGTRVFAKSEASEVDATCDAGGSLVAAVTRTPDTDPVIRTGSPEDFIARRETIRPLRGVLGAVTRLRLSPDARHLWLLCTSGALYCVAVASATALASLQPSVPFTDVAAGPLCHSSVLLVQDETDLVCCDLEA